MDFAAHLWNICPPLDEQARSQTMIVFLHTSPVHVARFDALRDRIAPGQRIRHVVREDLMDRTIAEGGLTPDIQAAARQALADALTPEVKALVCTCSMIGQVAEAYDAEASVPVLRVDRPMTDQAVMQARNIAVCATYPLSLAATVALVRSSADYLQRPKVIVTEHLFPAAWPLFESGEMEAYFQAVALGIRGVSLSADLILLAQASMEGAIPLCGDIDIPIWSSPEIGFRTALSLIENMEKMQ